MIHIMSDSAADYTLNEAKEKEITIIPLSIVFEDQEYDGPADEDFQDFYRKLEKSKYLPKSSQPSPEAFLEVFRQAKEKQEDVVLITISSGLSGTYQSAHIAKSLVNYDRIWIIDSQTAIMAQRIIVDYAITLRDQGHSAQEIVGYVEAMKNNTVVFGALDTLLYLSKGGRIPASLAYLGDVIRIKPLIIEINGKLEMLGKAFGKKSAFKALQDKIMEYVIDKTFPVFFGYTQNIERGLEFMSHTIDKLGLSSDGLCSIGGTIGTHVGPNAVAVAFVQVPQENKD